MKRLALLLIASLLLTSCKNSTIQPTMTAIETLPPVSTPTFTPSSTETPGPTLLPTLTPIPCPSEGAPIVFGDIKIFFDNGVPPSECDLFATYLDRLNTWMSENGYTTGSLEVYVFSDSQRAADATYDIGSKRGCNPESKDDLLELWKRPGISALSVYGASFYQVFAGDWMSASFNRRVAGVIGENILSVDRNYVGGCEQFWKVPDWAQEGHAVYLTHLIETQWEIGPQQLPQECFTTLIELKAGQSCVYKEGAQAFALLGFTHPSVDYYDLLAMIENGKSFDDAFQKTYGIPVSQFYKQFDDFLYTCPGYSLPTLGLSIKCFGRMTNESLPPDLQGQENVYGFEVSGIDLTAHASELDQIIKAPKDATLAVDGNRLFVSIDSSTPKDRYVVSISIDGQSAGTSFEWKK